jgi:hypothetical protein
MVQELALEPVGAIPLGEAKANLLLVALGIEPIMLEWAILTVHALPREVVAAFIWERSLLWLFHSRSDLLGVLLRGSGPHIRRGHR